MSAQLTKKLFTFLACLSIAIVASAQTKKTIKFDTRDEGEEKAVKYWGLDGTWLNFYNARASKKHAGDLIDFIRIGFYLHEETRSNGRLSDGQIEMLDEALRYVHVVDEKMPIKLSPNNMRALSIGIKTRMAVRI